MLVVGEYRNYFLKTSSMKVSQSFRAESCVSLLSPYCLLLKMWASAKAGLSNKEEAREAEIEGVLGKQLEMSSEEWWCIPVIPACGVWRQKDEELRSSSATW